MKKIFKLTGILFAIFLGSVAVYWFNLDNKLLYYVVRPILNKVYDSKKKGVRL